MGRHCGVQAPIYWLRIRKLASYDPLNRCLLFVFQGGEQPIQLLERLNRRIRSSSASRVEGFLRGIELAQDQQRFALLLLEGHRGDGPRVTTLLIGPDEARVRRDFEVPAEEIHA